MALHMGTELPSLEGATQWLNGGPLHRQELTGKPTLIHFWAVSCHLCKETMPTVNRWRDTYQPLGLQVIAVHMPRSQEDTATEAVQEAIQRYQLTQPVAIDNQHAVKRAFANEFVPAFYLFDAQGYLRHFQAGDRGLRMVERRIRRLLDLPEEDATEG
ncbi:MAG: redoxin domain-containing protein [Limnochordaceae bacterium]|nr:redoxin domain-containing protein [Limnochordaceae bacterium]